MEGAPPGSAAVCALQRPMR